MNPTRSDVHIKRPLTNISVAYIQKQDDFMASKFFPIINVNKQSDSYFTYDKGDFMRDEMEQRSPSSKSAGGGYAIDANNFYNCIPYAFHKDIDDDIRDNSDAPLDMDRDATQFVSQKGLIKMERLFFTNFYKTGVWSEDFTPGTKWDAGNSTPIKDIKIKILKIKRLTGYKPNILGLSPDVLDVLTEHDDFTDRIKYTSSDSVDLDMIAKLIGIKKVMVADAVYNKAAKGVAVNMDFIVPAKTALLGYANDAPSILTPSAGYIFAWKRRGLAGKFGNAIKKFYLQEIKSDRIEIEMAIDPKLIAADCGIFFDAVLT